MITTSAAGLGLPLDLELAVRQELLPSERILWSARPRAAKMGANFLLWLFAIPWTVFALFWEAAALSIWFADAGMSDGLRLGFGIVFPLFGLPFIAIGVAMLAKPLRAMRKAASTAYALTDQRLIRLVTKGKREVESVGLATVGPVRRREDRSGYGDLSIQTGRRIDGDGSINTDHFVVQGVPAVALLEKLLLQRSARSLEAELAAPGTKVLPEVPVSF